MTVNLIHIRIKYLPTLSITFLLIVSAPFHPESGMKDVYNILDFGAVEGGDKNCDQAIRDAIDTCHHQADGGRVDVPPGMFLPAPLSLKSNVNLHIETNSVLLGSEYFDDSHINGARISNCITGEETGVFLKITGEG